MGFWDTVGKAAASAGKAAVDSAKEGLEKQRQFKDLYADKSDSELFSILANATHQKTDCRRWCCARYFLSSRGYSSEDISAKVRSMI